MRFLLSVRFGSSSSQMFYKMGVLKNFADFTGEYYVEVSGSLLL